MGMFPSFGVKLARCWRSPRHHDENYRYNLIIEQYSMEEENLFIRCLTSSVTFSTENLAYVAHIHSVYKRFHNVF